MRAFIKDCHNFCLLMIGFAISKIGSSIYDVVIMWWLAKLTGSAKMSSYVLAAGIMPKIFIGFLACGFIDKIYKKTMMIITDVISGLVSIITAYMVYINYVDMKILISCTIILSICSTLFNPSIKSLFPNMVKEKYLLKCNSLHIAIRDISKIVGPLIGGAVLLIEGFAIEWIFLINGLSFISSALLECTIDTNEEETHHDKRILSLNDIIEGLKYVWQKKEVRNIMLLCMITNIFLSSANVLLPAYIMYVIKGNEFLYTVVTASEIIGSLLLTIVILKRKDINNKQNCMFFCITIVGISLSLLYFAIPIICCIAYLIMGGLLALFSSLNSALLQVKTEPEYLGRVNTLNLTLALLASPLGALLFGRVGNHAICTIFAICGWGIVLSALFIYLISKKERYIKTNVKE